MVTVKGVPATFGLVMVLMVKWSKVLKLKVLLEPTAVPAVAVRMAFAPEPVMLRLPVQLAPENAPVLPGLTAVELPPTVALRMAVLPFTAAAGWSSMVRALMVTING